MLLTALEQLALQHQHRYGAGVGDDELSNDGVTSALSHRHVLTAEVVAPGGDSMAVPQREERQGAAGERPAQVQVQERHARTSRS